MIWMPGPHVQRSRPEVVRALMDTVLQQMAATPATTPAAATSGAP
jgi:hypothetical protein